MSDGFLSSKPVAYCWETPLDGWEIVSYSRAESEPELRWRKMIAITDAEREAVEAAKELWVEESQDDRVAATLRGLLERIK